VTETETEKEVVAVRQWHFASSVKRKLLLRINFVRFARISMLNQIQLQRCFSVGGVRVYVCLCVCVCLAFIEL